MIRDLLPPLDKNNNPKVFLGWSLTENGAATYYPGAKLFIDGHGDSAITLYAVWGDKQTTTTVTYHANYPDGTDATELHKVDSNEKIINNSYIILKSPADLGFSKENYNFVGWSRTAAGPAEFNADSKVGVDNNGNISSTNDIYGIWEVKKEVTVTIKGGQYNKPYDGQSHSVSFTLTTSDASYDLANVYYNYQESEYQYGSDNAKISGKDVCDLEMGLSTSQFVNKDSSVKVTFVLEQDAKLKIEPFEIVINALGKQREYNGKELKAEDTNPGYTPTSLPNGETIKVDFSGSVKHVSDGEVKITYNITWLTAKESNYTINDNGVGYLKITPKTVTVKSRSLEKEYDGTPLTNETKSGRGFKETEPENDGKTDFVDGEGIVLTGKPDCYQTEVGSRPNEFTYEAKDGTDLDDYKLPDNLGNAGSGTVGELKVVKNTTKITVTAQTKEHEYDGQEFSWNKADVTPDDFTQTYDVTYTVEGKVKHVSDNASNNNVVKDVKIWKDGKDVTNQFVTPDKRKPGTISITPKTLTVNTRDKSWTYDGQKHDASELNGNSDGKPYWEIQGFVEGESASLKLKGSEEKSVKNVSDGPKDNDEYVLLWDEPADPADKKAQETDYKVEKGTFGTLSITKRTVTIKSRSLTKEYDGKVLKGDTPEKDGVTWTAPMINQGWVDGEGIDEDKN